MKHSHEHTTYVDPVCGMKLSLKTAAEEAVYEGHTYYFCAAVCREAFEADPGRYAHKHKSAHQKEDGQ